MLEAIKATTRVDLWKENAILIEIDAVEVILKKEQKEERRVEGKECRRGKRRRRKGGRRCLSKERGKRVKYEWERRFKRPQSQLAQQVDSVEERGSDSGSVKTKRMRSKGQGGVASLREGRLYTFR